VGSLTPILRQISSTGVPASACRKAKAICFCIRWPGVKPAVLSTHAFEHRAPQVLCFCSWSAEAPNKMKFEAGAAHLALRRADRRRSNRSPELAQPAPCGARLPVVAAAG
jgi:hypothetical protein